MFGQAPEEQPGDTDPNLTYSCFLVKPLRKRLQTLKETPPTDATTWPSLSQLFDTVRGIPYAATSHTDKQKTDSFYRFADAVELDCSNNPDLAAIQTTMVEHGWAQVCFEVLAADELKELHLVCLQFLMALTGGGNAAVQDQILMDLQNLQQNPSDPIAEGFRWLFAKGTADLKAQRKSIAAGDGDAEQTGFAWEVMCVLANCCKGHTGMQDYIREQTGHLERHDLIADAVAYMTQLERDMKEMVKAESGTEEVVAIGDALIPEQFMAGTMFDNAPEEKNGKSEDAASSAVMQRSIAGFQFLKFMASGPHKVNQLVIANSDLLSIVNRILAYTEYEEVEDIDEAGSVLATAKGLLNAQISFALLSLVEGLPDPAVVSRLINGLKWEHFLRHLNVLKRMIGEGVIEAPQRAGQGDDGGKKKMKKKKKKGKEKSAAKLVPKYVVDPKTGIAAEWLRREAFRFYSFYVKIKLGADALKAAGEADPYGPLRPMLKDADLSDFFEERVGQAEVVRDNALENLFFWMPPNKRLAADDRMIQDRVKFVLDKAPREDTTEKLMWFLEGSYEVASGIESINTVRRARGDRLPGFYAWSARTTPTMFISFLLCVVMCVSLERDSSRESLDREAFARWPQGFEIFIALGLLHFLITLIRTYAFTVMRVPVLREMYTRSAKLEYRGTHDSDGIDHDVFAGNTIIVYGLPYNIPGTTTQISDSYIRSVFQKEGGITVVRTTPVVPQTGADGDWAASNNSWALISFNRASIVSDLMEKQEKSGGKLKMGGALKSSPLEVIDLQMDSVEGNAALEKMVEDAEIEMLSQTDDLGRMGAIEVDAIVNKLPILPSLLPFTIIDMYIFKNDAEVRECFLDILFSFLGIYWSPLAFVFHLFKLTKKEGAKIVVVSLTQNLGRLSVTIALCLLFTWAFAISGWLVFAKFHVESTTENEGGPNANLLTIFFTYAYSSLQQAGVGGWVTGLVFPLQGSDIIKDL